MRPSTSPYKNYPFIDVLAPLGPVPCASEPAWLGAATTTKRPQTRWSATLALATLLLGACHQFGDNSTSSSVAETIEREPTSIVMTRADQKPVIAARLNRSACDSGIGPHLTVMIKSPVATHQLSISRNSLGETSLRFDEVARPLRGEFFFWNKILPRFCKDPSESYQLTAEEALEFQDFLATIIPGCAIEAPQNDLWNCPISAMDVKKLQVELQGTHKSLLHLYQRHSYLLIRRTAVAIQLAKALQAEAAVEHLDSFCGLLRNSFPEEVPLALRSKAWRNAACETTGNRIGAAMWGLERSHAELEAVVGLLKTQSYQSVLSIRIPASEVPRRDLWVSLVPEPVAADSGENARHPCFHPLFVDPDHLQAAIKLGFSNLPSKNLCGAVESYKGDPSFAHNYVFASLASETEFSIANGNSKELMLPVGNYSYTIKEDQQRNPQGDKADATSHGLITWGPKVTQPTLTRW